MKIFNQIQELQNQGVITPETALDISNYYKGKNKIEKNNENEN